jgi:hypothetical protein
MEKQQLTNEPTSEAWEASVLPLNYARSLSSPQDHLAAPFAERPTVGLRRRFQLRVLFLADFETDGFRAQRRLHHDLASFWD